MRRQALAGVGHRRCDGRAGRRPRAPPAHRSGGRDRSSRPGSPSRPRSCVSGYERAPVPIGGTVLVVGPGPIGILAALVARAAGAGRVVLAGRPSSKGRLELAASLGIETWLDDDSLADGSVGDGRATIPDRVHAETAGRGADLVVEASGSAGGDRHLRRRGAAPGDHARARRPRRPGRPGALGRRDEPGARRGVLAVVVLVELGRGARADGPRRRWTPLRWPPCSPWMLGGTPSRPSPTVRPSRP